MRKRQPFDVGIEAHLQAVRVYVAEDLPLWLACNVVHGDLSAYNVLWDGSRIVTIDFPQACDPRFNTSAESLLSRDVANVCRHFARWGVQADANAIVDDLWTRFVSGDL